MAWSIPTLADLTGRVRNAFRAYLPGSDAYIWPNNVYVAAKVIAGSNAEVMGRLDYVRKQAFILTQDWDYLLQSGAQYGLPPQAATAAGGTATVTAADVLTIPAGTLFTTSAGTGYLATADLALTAPGTLSVPLIAETPGSAGLAQPGTPLTIGAGPTGAGPSGAGLLLASAVVGPNGLTGGADAESTEAYRARLLFRLRNPPRGGAPPDYVTWVTAVPGVTRVFLERLWKGPGTLRVFPLFDDLFPATGGVADTAHVQTVIAALEGLVPGDAAVAVMAPMPLFINVVIANLQPLSASVQTAIQAELLDTFRRLGLVAGNDTPVAALPYLATPQSFSAEWISQAIANATGTQRFILVSPTADTTIPAGYIPVLGAVDYIQE